MNKYEGLLELRDLGIPSIEWKEYCFNNAELSERVLWTVRVANRYGRDMKLPCKLGVSAKEALKYMKSLRSKYDLVIFSEFFESKISGNLGILYDKIIIEWTYGSSRNLTIHGLFEESIILTDKSDLETVYSKLNKKECQKLFQYGIKVKNTYRDFLLDNKFVILEWSITAAVSKKRIPLTNYRDGEMVFYDLRIV